MKQEVVETIVSDNLKNVSFNPVTIIAMMSGENKTVKYKKAQALIAKGEWF